MAKEKVNIVKKTLYKIQINYKSGISVTTWFSKFDINGDEYIWENGIDPSVLNSLNIKFAEKYLTLKEYKDQISIKRFHILYLNPSEIESIYRIDGKVVKFYK